jgi:hypothetical protein
MKLALLSGANPRTCKHGPAVRLHEGSWRLNVQGLVDSSLLMHVEGYEASNLIHNGMMIPVNGETAIVQLSFGVRGSEDYITVIAEKVA